MDNIHCMSIVRNKLRNYVHLLELTYVSVYTHMHRHMFARTLTNKQTHTCTCTLQELIKSKHYGKMGVGSCNYIN